MIRAATVDEYISLGGDWTECLIQIRDLINSTDLQEIILSYLAEAIENQKAGKEIKPERNNALVIPEELEQAFKEDPALKDIFDALSLSKRREYAGHVASAKREETREKRLTKIIPMIIEGIGLSDKYKS